MVQQDLSLLRGGGKDHRRQQGLGHGLVPRRLHPVKLHPLMGGVLVDEVDRIPLLHDQVGLQNLSRQPPGGLLFQGGGRNRSAFGPAQRGRGNLQL